MWLDSFELNHIESYEFSFYSDLLRDNIKNVLYVDMGNSRINTQAYILKSSLVTTNEPLGATLADEVAFLN